MNTAHTIQYLLEGLTLGGVALVALLVTRNRVIRRRMLFTILVVLVELSLHVAGDFGLLGGAPDRLAQTLTAERLLVALALISILVALAFNPWFADRVRDRAPAIVQDALVIGLFLFVAIVFYPQDANLFATSAIAAAVLGFALQETLGNAFAGLAIQTEKPFRVGHWVAIAGYEGRVAEVTWRATKIWTKAGNLVILPNNVVAREAINNYTEPTAPTRVFVEVGATYSAPPNDVRAALLDAVGRAPHVLSDPGPDVLVHDFGASAIIYRVRFWIDNFEAEEVTRSDVRRAIYYEFARHGIEIPWPIQVEYHREDAHEPAPARVERFAAIIGGVPILAALPVEGRRALATSSSQRLFGDGEVIVREADPGASMFVVCRGEVAVTIGKGHEVARTKAGGYFGEMSLLTGEPRSATVNAVGDCSVLEISGAAFKDYVISHPEVIDQLAQAASVRRRELDQSRAAAAAAPADAKLSLADRMKRFFGLV